MGLFSWDAGNSMIKHNCFTVSPRNCPAVSVNGKFGSDLPGIHFLGDLLQLSFASSQRDLFEEGWMEFVTRVYWLKARFLALQVCSTLVLTELLSAIKNHVILSSFYV